MQQAFGIQSLDGSIIGVGATRDSLQRLIDDDPILNFGTEIVPLEINTEPLTDKGRAIQLEIRRVWDEKNITNLHFDKQPGWFKLSADERAQFILDLLLMDHKNMEDVDLDEGLLD